MESSDKSKKISILIADDDENISKLISMECEEEGYSVDVVSDGQQAILKLRKNNFFSLAILDWDMPMMSGYDVCRMLREKGSKIPILMVTAKDEIDDRVKALDAGADDYLCKPFNIRELLARVRSLVRRSIGETSEKSILKFENITLNKDEHRCTISNKEIHLTVREFELLAALMGQPNQVFPRGQLIQKVWGDDYFGDESVVDTYIKYLRAKLKDSGEGELIKTIRGVGFSLRRD